MEWILKVPKNVGSIGDKAFERCGKLKKVQIPDSVTHFGYWTFSSKPTIYAWVFDTCEKLSEEDNAQIESIIQVCNARADANNYFCKLIAS